MSDQIPPAGEPISTMDEDKFYDAWDDQVGNPLASDEIRRLAAAGLIRLRTPEGEIYEIEIGPDGRPRRQSGL